MLILVLDLFCFLLHSCVKARPSFHSVENLLGLLLPKPSPESCAAARVAWVFVAVVLSLLVLVSAPPPLFVSDSVRPQARCARACLSRRARRATRLSSCSPFVLLSVVGLRSHRRPHSWFLRASISRAVCWLNRVSAVCFSFLQILACLVLCMLTAAQGSSRFSFSVSRSEVL
jgi:hypothetical protein